MCLIAETEKARLVKISSDPEKYEVIEDGSIKDFDDLESAQSWFDLVSE